jgi:hypothetical protein
MAFSDVTAREQRANKAMESLQFREIAERIFQALTSQLQQEALAMNETCSIALRSPIRINGRDIQPDDEYTLFLDRLAYPVILLTVRLSIGTRSIHLRQEKIVSRGEAIGTITNEYLPIDDDEIITTPQGKPLIIREASKYILKRFLAA